VIRLALVTAIFVHVGGASLYEATRTVPDPVLQVDFEGEGTGIVLSAPAGIHCGEDCRMSATRGSLIKLTATIGEGSTFAGWRGPCGSRSFEIFAWAQGILYPSGAQGSVTGAGDALREFLQTASEEPLAEYPLECEVFLEDSTHIVAKFGRPPEVVEVAMLSESSDPMAEETTLSLPTRAVLPKEVLDLTKEIEKIADKEPELVPTPAPVPVPLLPIPKPNVAPTPPPPVPQIAKAPKMKAVEVPDENEVESAPADAHFLSDKNRDVAEETRATETNLSKQSDGKRVASAKSDVASEDVGGEEETIAQLEDLEETSLDAKRDNDEAIGSEDGAVVMEHSGENGKNGENGEAGDESPNKKPGMLSMRNIEGRGALGTSGEKVNDAASDPSSGGKRGRRGKKGFAGPKLRLAQEDYERIVGKEVADAERAVARHKQSRRRGRWERKLGMMKSALENFTPEVRAGNQTALKTRAAPFALYIARMHRRIHELWGFGFLEELEHKSASNPLNNWNLVTKLEIVINPDGSIDKMTIVNPSGLLSFDVAALDVVDTAGPYESTPRKIRSPDGKVYMHWSFHRDWRQCGTFGAEPFILSTIPKGADRGMDDSKLLRQARGKRRQPRRAAVHENGGGKEAGVLAAAARANANLPTPRDPAALGLANRWLTAFVAGDANKLATLSAGSFRSGDRVVAKSRADIAAIYKTVIGELSSRRIQGWKILSAAGYRQRFGALPRGLEANGTELFLVVLLQGDPITLTLESAKTTYRITGLYR